MRHRYLLFVVAILLALIPGAAMAQTVDEDEGLLLRITGNVLVPENERLGAVIVIDGNARVEGRVDSLIVIDGEATVTGEVEDSIVVVSGTLNLEASARVNDVTLVRSDLNRDSGATVTGDIQEQERFFFRGAWTLFSVVNLK